MAYTDRFPLLGNFIETQLSSAVAAEVTTLRLDSVDGFPDIIAGKDYIPCVIRTGTTAREIVYVTAVNRTESTVTVERGKEVSDATAGKGLAWSNGSYIYATMTAQSLERARLNGFAPLVDSGNNRPALARVSATSINITGNFSSDIEVGVAVRIITSTGVIKATDASGIHVKSVTYTSSTGKTKIVVDNVSIGSSVVLKGIDVGIMPSAAPQVVVDVTTVPVDNVTIKKNSTGNLYAVNATASSYGMVQVSDSISATGAAANGLVPSQKALKQVSDAKLNLSGGTVTGGIKITLNNDVSATSTTTAPLTIGPDDLTSSAHLVLDRNEIMAKATESTPGTLYIQNDGGKVGIGSSNNHLLSCSIFSDSTLIGGTKTDVASDTIYLRNMSSSDTMNLTIKNGSKGSTVINDNVTIDASGNTTILKLFIQTAGYIYSKVKDSVLKLCGDSRGTYGAVLNLYGGSHDKLPGVFSLITRDGTTGYELRGNKTALTWKGNTVDCIASRKKNTSSWYRKFDDGFIIQGGVVNVTNGVQEVTFPTAFSTSGTVTVFCNAKNAPSSNSDDNNYVANPKNVGTTKFTIYYYDSDGGNSRSGYVSWMAMGY